MNRRVELILGLACLGGCHWLLPFGAPDRSVDRAPVGDRRATDRLAALDARTERRDAAAVDQPHLDGPRGVEKRADLKIKLDSPKIDVKKPDLTPKGDVKKPDLKLGQPDMAVPVGCELTEQSNGLSPQALCSQPNCSPFGGSCGITGYYITGSYAKVGTTAYKLACGSTCNKQNAVRYTRSTSWNLTAHTGIQFWINMNTASTDLDCGYTPWIMLYDTSGRLRKITRSSPTQPPFINNYINQWLQVTAPLHASNTNWYIINETGFDPTKVKSIEIDLQPAGGGFTAHIDGLTITGGSSPFSQCSP